MYNYPESVYRVLEKLESTPSHVVWHNDFATDHLEDALTIACHHELVESSTAALRHSGPLTSVAYDSPEATAKILDYLSASPWNPKYSFTPKGRFELAMCREAKKSADAASSQETKVSTTDRSSANKATKKKRGRPKISKEQREWRQKMIQEWEMYHDSKTGSKKEFCQEKGISLKKFARLLDAERMARLREESERK